MTRPTKEEMLAALDVATAALEAVREAGSMPAGHLYAMLCGSVSLGGFDALVESLGRAKLVKREGDLLRWIGPRVAA
jgi:hypothetical protein